MKSTESAVTDSIENQSLPSIPLYRGREDGLTQTPYRLRSSRFQTAPGPTPVSSRLPNRQKSFANTSSKTPELNKINEYAVLKVYEHRNFGKSPSMYSRMSEDYSSLNLPKCRSFIQNRPKFYIPNLKSQYFRMDSVRLFFITISTNSYYMKFLLFKLNLD